MIWILGIIAITILLGLGWAWFYFIKGHALPPASEIREVVIYYSEKIGDLLPDDYDPTEFVLTSAEEIRLLREKLEGVPISRIPLIDSDEVEEGPNWILNMYFKNGDFRFVSVDKKHVSGNETNNSGVYQYLRGNYTE